MGWVKLVTRPLTEEEVTEGYDYDFMWDCITPEIDEEVLVSDGKNVWTDTWVECFPGVGFEYTYPEEHSIIYWMSFPEPPKEVE